MSELETLQEQLTRVRKIIGDIEEHGYSSLGMDGKQLTTLDLKTLYDRETYLKTEIAATDADITGIMTTRLIRWGKE